MFKNMGNSFLSKRKIFRTLIIHYIFTIYHNFVELIQKHIYRMFSVQFIADPIDRFSMYLNIQQQNSSEEKSELLLLSKGNKAQVIFPVVGH